MTERVLFAVGDAVTIRNARGLWRVVEIRPVSDEAVVVRGVYGQVRRTVPASEVVPAREAGAR